MLVMYLGVVVAVYADESFITKEEYAKHFYHNPRGIGCHKCHGEKGQGKVVAYYKEKGGLKSFEGPPIENLDYSTFYKAMNRRLKGMPRYYLTTQEIRILYYYLKMKKKDKKDGS